MSPTGDNRTTGGCFLFIPQLGNDERRLAGGLADDHAGLVRDGDALEAKIAAEDRDMQSHSGEVFGRSRIPAVQVSGNGDRNLAVNSGPSAFDGSGIRRPIENLVFAGVVRKGNQIPEERVRD